MADKTNNEDITSLEDLELKDEDLASLGVKVPKAEEEEEEDKKDEEDKEEEIIVEDEDEGGTLDKDSESEAAKAYAQLLVQEGILDKADEVKSFNDILKLEREKGDRVINEFVDDLPPKLGEQIKAHLKGVNVEEVSDTISSIAYLEGLTPEVIKNNTEVAVKLYQDLLKLEGEDDEYIKEQVQLAKDSDTIGKQGARAKTKILNMHRAKLEEKEKQVKAQEEAIKKSQEEWINTLNQVFDGDKGIWDIKLNPKEKKEVRAIIFDSAEERVINGQKVAITALQKVLEDPITLAQIALGIKKGMFGKEGKLTLAKNKAKIETIELLENAIKDKTKTSDNSSIGQLSNSYKKSIKAVTDVFSGLKV